MKLSTKNEILWIALGSSFVKMPVSRWAKLRSLIKLYKSCKNLKLPVTFAIYNLIDRDF